MRYPSRNHTRILENARPYVAEAQGLEERALFAEVSGGVVLGGEVDAGSKNNGGC